MENLVSVTGCYNCPFCIGPADTNYPLICSHPSFNIDKDNYYREFTVEEEDVPEIPYWCPLIYNSVTIKLVTNGERDNERICDTVPVGRELQRDIPQLTHERTEEV